MKAMNVNRRKSEQINTFHCNVDLKDNVTIGNFLNFFQLMFIKKPDNSITAFNDYCTF